MDEEKEGKWLSDEGVVNLKDIQAGKLNIIDSPCGCGKPRLWKRNFGKRRFGVICSTS